MVKRCSVKGCGEKYYASGKCKKHYYKKYYQRPEVKERKREYRQRPEVKERKREYRQRPEVKERQREYYQRPEVKERKREYYQRPEVKERQREYRQRPEVKEWQREYRQRPEVKVAKAILVSIKRLERKKQKAGFLSKTDEERLSCYQRAYELNVLEGSLKRGEVKIPLCAINAKQISEEAKGG